MNSEENLCWFHGKLSREQADQVLQKDESGDGHFLVRESHSSDGDFVLSVRHLADVFHYQIRRHGEDAFFSIDDQQPIHGLDSLIDHYRAAANGLITHLSGFVRGSAPPHDTRSHGRTNLLHRATKEGDFRVVSELLKCGYRNIDAKNQDGQTAVHLACRIGNEQLVEKLITSGSNVNCRDSEGNTPLHYACRNNSVAIIKLLVMAKANLQARNNTTGCVPFHEAARNGHLPAVCEMLALGAPLMARSTYGELPIDFAREGAHHEVADYLDGYKAPEPKTYKFQWYHGTLDRHESNRILVQHAAVLQAENAKNSNSEEFCASGVFLVRFSSKSGDYVLTMLADSQTKHFIIQKYMRFLYIDDGPYLPSLEHLIQHYMLFSDGLPVNLRFPVPPKPKPPLPLFSTMPKDARLKLQSSPENPKIAIASTSNLPLSLPKENKTNAPVDVPSIPIKSSKQGRYTDNLNFRSLMSPKKNIVIDGMRSLRKSKKSKAALSLSAASNTPPPITELSMSLKNLSFSSDLRPVQDDLYNVPTNNAAVVELTTNTASSPTPLLVSSDCFESSRQSNYFTDSDYSTSKDTETEEIYFVDAPTAVPTPLATPAALPPTVEAPFSYAQFSMVPQFTSCVTANPTLQQTNNNPPIPVRFDRLESTVSLTSTASDRFFRQQLSVDSNHPLAATDSGAGGDSPNYFIPAESLEQKDILGEGEFGSVFRGTLKWSFDGKTTENIPVAIKTLHDEHCKQNRAEFLREASVMIKLAHHCIVRLIGISKGPPLMMVQELVGLGSMLTYILDNAPSISVHYEIKLWAAQIACGMDYLESRHFVHRDLAARNILLSSRNQAKISDFGLSRALSADNNYYQASQGGKWPIKWYAPESYNYGTFSHASDVWSFGVTLWEMFSFGLVPYGDMKGVDVIGVLEQGDRLKAPAKCPEPIFKCMESCWNYHPKDRPSFRYLTRFFASDPDYQNIVEMIGTEQIG